MKNLLYKEFKLAVHPICYVFVLAFPLMVFIPSYPLYISYIYICATYPVLFLGANKGVQTNDLLFTCLLPVRKKDIVLSRMITCSILQATSMAITTILAQIAKVVLKDVSLSSAKQASHMSNTPTLAVIGFGYNEYLLILASVLIAFSIFDLIFFPLYYRNGRSILLGTIVGMLAFIAVTMILTTVLPLESTSYSRFCLALGTSGQALVFLISLVFYLAAHFLVYKASASLLEKVDL